MHISIFSEITTWLCH